MREKGFSKALILLLLLTLAGAGWFFYDHYADLAEKSPAMAQRNASAQRKPNGIPVRVLPVKEGHWEVWKNYYGRISSSASQSVTSYVREYITALYVEVGDRVNKGDVLLELSREVQSAQFQASAADYRQAESDYRRKKALFEAGGLSRQEVDQASVALKQKKSALQNSRTSVSRTKVRAQINGVVVSRNADPGDIADSGRELLEICGTANIEVKVLVPPADAARIATGATAIAGSSESPERAFVSRIEPQADPVTGLRTVVVALPEDCNAGLGDYLNVRIRLESRDNAIAIPYESIRRNGSGDHVFVISGDRAIKRPVKVLDGQGRKSALEAGLSDGDLLVVEGQDFLYDGAKVKVIVPQADDTGKEESRGKGIRS